MPFLAPLALAAAFAAVLWPFYLRMRTKLEGHNDLAALSAVLLTALGILLPLGFILVLMGWEAAKLYLEAFAYDPFFPNNFEFPDYESGGKKEARGESPIALELDDLFYFFVHPISLTLSAFPESSIQNRLSSAQRSGNTQRSKINSARCRL